jgi:thioredoxin reductase (NADPH)
MEGPKTDKGYLQAHRSNHNTPAQMHSNSKNRDLIVIGGGPAGLTAGIYGARSGLDTLVLEMMIPGGTIAEAAVVENYPGFPEGISGSELAERLKHQCEKSGAELRIMEKVTDLHLNQDMKYVLTDNRKYASSAIIIATGSRRKSLGLPSEDRLRGKGISYCALCDGPLYRDKRVLVVGGGNSAAIDAYYLSNIASSVILVHRSSTLRAESALVEKLIDNGVEIFYNTKVQGFNGDERLVSAELINKKIGKNMEIAVDGVFVQIGSVPNSGLAKKAGLLLDEQGYIVVDSRQRTNIDGVFAAGDVATTPYRQCGTAVGSAIVAAIEAYGYVENPYYYKA